MFFMCILLAIFAGIFFGLIVAGFGILICKIINCIMDKYIDSEIAVWIGLIAGVIVFIVGIWCAFDYNSANKYVDIYSEDGQIAETYQIDDYYTSYYATRFYLADGREIIISDGMYNIRIED